MTDVTEKTTPRTAVVGTSVPRKQDARLLLGRGRFVDDVQAPGMLYCAILRSPHAHARIVRIDTSRAKAMPGVVDVLTGAEAAEFSKPLPPTINIAMRMVDTAYAIAVDKVVYEGEPVAAVAATDRYVAEDALEAIHVDYEPLPVVRSIEESLAPDAPKLYEDWDDNVQLAWGMKTGDTDAAFAASKWVVEERFTHSRYTGTPIEGRGVVAQFDPLSGELSVTASTQAAHQSRTLLAEALGMPEQKLRVTARDIGGGFGNKLQVDAEVIPCLLSIRTHQPVKWVETRTENLTSGVHSREYVWEITGGFAEDGTITALKAKLTCDAGCDGANRSSGVGAALVGGFYISGSYRVPMVEVETIGVVTNKAPYGAYRGYGKDIATDGIERFLDFAAKKIGMDPYELRRRNFIQADEYPYTIPTGPIYDSGDVPRLLQMAQDALSYDDFRDRQEAARKEGTYLGIGLACMTEPSGGAVPNCIFNGYEPAIVRVTPEGGVMLLTGMQEIGQGIETTLSQVVADEFTVSPDEVRVIYGDTDTVPYGLGAWSSRGATFSVSSAVLASRKLTEKLLKVAAHMLEVPVEDVELRDGAVQVAGVPEKRMTLADIGRAVHLWPGPYVTLPEGEEPGLEASAYFTGPMVRWVPDEIGTLSVYTTHPTGCFGAIVEVDVETGKTRVERMVIAHDCGSVINPTVVEGQISGGAVQGISGALLEELTYDEQGRLRQRGFRDYLAPTMGDVPSIEIMHHYSPSPYTPLGTKGMGEGGAIGSPAAIISAVQDALEPFDVAVRELPMSPDRLLRLIEAGRSRSQEQG